MRNNRPLRLSAVLVTAAVLTASVLLAQEVPSTEGKKIEELWEDFLHYVRVARPEYAQSFGRAILDSGAEAREIYRLADKTPGSYSVLARGARLEGLKEIVAELRKVIEKGYEAEWSDPNQIARSIEMLGGTVRGFEMAARRLEISGEYAMPQLFQKLTDPQTPQVLRERIVVLLPRLGKGVVRPMSVALLTSDAKFQEVLANALGEIGYPHAAPRLKELAEREGILARTEKAAQRALVACAGQAALKKSVAAIYYEQALSYYYRRESVAPDVRSGRANVWYWRQDHGLTYTPVPREIFCDIYAMRMARLALQHDENFYPAVSLWIAANLKRAADMPEGAVDDTYGRETPSAEYFALASSAKYLQDVLGRALNDQDSTVARRAIEALARTAGTKNLVKPIAGGAQPLVQALGYSDQRVRFLAAVSLANALPEKRFTGHELVMTQLIETLRQTGQRTALMIVADQQRGNMLKAAMREAGYRVIENPDPAEALVAAHRSAGVDVAVLAASPDPVAVVRRFRQDPAFVMLPVVIAGRTGALRSLAAKDGRVVLVEASADVDEVAAALADAGRLAAGEEMSPQEAASWMIRAASAIERLGETENPVFDILRAEGSLIAALADDRLAVRLAASRGLAVMRSPAAQRAIAELAVNAEVPEDVCIEALADLSASLRRFGNQLTEELSQAVLEVVRGEGSAELLNAAAQALGAMNLPSEKIKSLILQTSD